MLARLLLNLRKNGIYKAVTICNIFVLTCVVAGLVEGLVFHAPQQQLVLFQRQQVSLTGCLRARLSRTEMRRGCRSLMALKDEVREAVGGLQWPQLLVREWVTTHCRDEGSAGTGSTFEAGAMSRSVSVLQWNVLCDGLSGKHPQKGGFVMSPPDSLDWEKRKWRILEEILAWDCDIITLQEVDHHEDWFSPQLERLGYRGLFVKKPDAAGLAYGSGLEDGCSVFYRSSQGMELLDARCFSFCIQENKPGGNGGTDSYGAGEETKVEGTVQWRDRAVQNQVAALALFRCVNKQEGHQPQGHQQEKHSEPKEEKLFVLATTHLKASKEEAGEYVRTQQVRRWDWSCCDNCTPRKSTMGKKLQSSWISPDGPKMRPTVLKKTEQLLEEVERFRALHSSSRHLQLEDVPVIVTGDFNATPHPSDGPTGTYEPLCYRTVLQHPLRLRSMFDVDHTFTTWKIRPLGGSAGRSGGEEGVTREVKHCIDYVWASDGVDTVRWSSMPTAEALGPARAPSYVYPSDHFSLAVELRLP
ncbi:unnamed protein product [Discosporangium mesarthrocarpum]